MFRFWDPTVLASLLHYIRLNFSKLVTIANNCDPVFWFSYVHSLMFYKDLRATINPISKWKCSSTSKLILTIQILNVFGIWSPQYRSRVPVKLGFQMVQSRPIIERCRLQMTPKNRTKIAVFCHFLCINLCAVIRWAKF